MLLCLQQTISTDILLWLNCIASLSFSNCLFYWQISIRLLSHCTIHDRYLCQSQSFCRVIIYRVVSSVWSLWEDSFNRKTSFDSICFSVLKYKLLSMKKICINLFILYIYMYKTMIILYCIFLDHLNRHWDMKQQEGICLCWIETMYKKVCNKYEQSDTCSSTRW